MRWMSSSISKLICMVLIIALAAPPLAQASPKPLTPEQIHLRIVKLGMGSWVGIRLQNGTAFSGRIVSYDNQGFSLLKYGETEATKVAYADVYEIQMGMPIARS